MDAYFDESGFTGDDLLQADQPVFVSASPSLGTAEAQRLLDTTIGPLPNGAVEHKHSRLVRTSAGRDRVVAFIRDLSLTRDRAAFFTTFKRFALLAKLVDNWIEPAMHEAGYDLYANAGARATANMLYYCLQGFEGEARFDELLRCYQIFSRDPTEAGYVHFLADTERLQATALREESVDLFGYVIVALRILGPAYATVLSNARANDIAFGSLFRLLTYWDAVFQSPFAVIHDQSTNVERVRQVLEGVMRVTGEQIEVASDDRLTYRLPIRATRLSFAASTDCPQLQVCDILAGAAATAARWVLERSRHTEYVQALLGAGLDSMSLGLIAPSPDDIAPRGPAAPGTRNPLDVMAQLIRDDRGE